MKKITKFIFMAFAVVLALTACSPNDSFLLGNSTITADQVSFSAVPSETNANIILFTNTSNINIPTSSVWDLGNGSVVKAATARGLYPEAGDYTVTLTVTSTDGTSVTTSQTIHIAKDDPTLFDTPVYNNLTGGASNADGKTWVFDQWNLYTAEVKTALEGKDIRGHIGLGPVDALTQEWWGAGPNEKSYEGTLASVGHGWTLYDWKLTFSMAGGLKLNITTGGEGYGRNALNGKEFNATWSNADDMAFPFDGGDYTFTLNEAGQFPSLTLSGDAFTGYYVGTQTYDIIYLTDEVMALRAHNTQEGQDWIFIYIREDLNKEPASINDDQVTFTMTPGSNEFNYDYSVTVENPNNVKFTTEVQFGDGATSTELSGSHEYIVPAGTYTARCVVTVGNKTITKEQTVTINNDHPLYNMSENLTGGRSWKLRPVSQGSGIIMTRTWTGEVWWTVDNTAAGSEAAYDDVLTFYAGGRAKLENNGDSFMNESTGGLFSDGDTSGSFVTKEYVPSDNASWEFVTVDGVLNLKLTNVFPMYAVSPDAMKEGLYEVDFITANLMHIKYVAGTGEWDVTWNYYLVPAN